MQALQLFFVVLGLLCSAHALPLKGLDWLAAETSLLFSDAHQGHIMEGSNLNGTEIDLGGLNTYISGDASSDKAVLIFHDIYGGTLENTRVWADRLAAAGYLAILPDFFKGDKPTPGGNNTAFLEKHPNEETLADISLVLQGIKDTFPNVQKLGTQGFCWGGRYAIELAGWLPPADVAVPFHAARFTVDDLFAIRAPTLLVAADPKLDKNFNESFVATAQRIFDFKTEIQGLDLGIKIYQGMMHGWALRGDSNDTAVAKDAESAFQTGLAFLKKHL